MTLTTRPDRIVWTTPVNRQAALQTAGVKATPDTPMQRRENLVIAAKRLFAEIRLERDGDKRRELTLKYAQVCQEIRRCGRWTPKRKHDFANWIVDVVRERLPRQEFMAILEEAGKRYSATQHDDADREEQARHRAMVERVKAVEL